MHDIDDVLLERMSSRELLELQTRIHDAIRAHIRAKNARLAAAAGPKAAPRAPLPQVEQGRLRSLAVHARVAHAAAAPVPAVSAPPANAPPGSAPAGAGEQPEVGDGAFDLERERDAWLARKRASSR